MELVAPAGDLQKLRCAYAYGADAAYIGLSSFSLRGRASGFTEADIEAVASLKSAYGKRLYGALNIQYHDETLAELKRLGPSLSSFPLDAIILSDPGAIDIAARIFPDAELHLSTQANCLNAPAARFWRRAGFSRVIPGRELGLAEIKAIKEAVPELGIEVFVHGAMCLAYSGRCFLSAWMAGRSGNDGNCAQSCRWEYRALEEAKRPGEYYPIIESEGHTTILSSRDIMMIDHLDDLERAGVDALKIEGRMRSAYYTAIVTGAYRRGLERLGGRQTEGYDDYRRELESVSHREYCTGFYYGPEIARRPTLKHHVSDSLFIGTVTKRIAPGLFELDLKNGFHSGDALESLSPGRVFEALGPYELRGEYGERLDRADPGKALSLAVDYPLEAGDLLRMRLVNTGA